MHLLLAQASGATVYEAIIGQAGVIALLLVIAVAGARKWWVWGYQYTDLEKRAERDAERHRAEIKEWKDIALTGLGVGEKAVDLFEAGGRHGRTE